MYSTIYNYSIAVLVIDPSSTSGCSSLAILLLLDQIEPKADQMMRSNGTESVGRSVGGLVNQQLGKPYNCIEEVDLLLRHCAIAPRLPVL